MSAITHKNAAKQPFMQLVRELGAAYQAFTIYDAGGLRRFGLTPAQADVLFTLGNTPGMTCKEIGEFTLITKGTLTGVVDRLEQKKMVKRITDQLDRRCTKVALTNKGTKVFEEVFPKQAAYLKMRFDRLPKKDRDGLVTSLQKLKGIF